MKKRLLCGIVPVVLAAGLISACSNNSNNAASSGSESANQASDKTSDGAEKGSDDYVYAKIDLPYADFYYGEINEVEPEKEPAKLTAQLDKEDAVEKAGFREKGFYDTVSSPTKGKVENFKAVFTKVEGEGSEYYGPKAVNIAISKSLYDDAKKAIEEKKTSKNQLLTLVGEIKETTDTAPAEYKVINSDGVLSKTIGKTEKNSEAKPEITTTSSYGNYELEVKGIEVDPEIIQGAVIETSDGKKYGLKHLDNLWTHADEIAFAAEEFKDNHDAFKGYERFKDIPGKTITKITYMLADTDDIEIDTSLFCKELAPKDYKLSGDEKVNYSKNGTEIKYTLETGDQKYTFERAVSRKKDVEAKIEAEKNGVLVLPAECTPGKYQLIFSNDKYADLSYTCLVESSLKAEDFSFSGNKLALKENADGIDVATYIKSISYAKVGETEYKGGKGRRFGETVFNEDGSVKLDAKYSSDKGDEKVFEGADTYKVTLKADGYPDIEFEVKQ